MARPRAAAARAKPLFCEKLRAGEEQAAISYHITAVLHITVAHSTARSLFVGAREAGQPVECRHRLLLRLRRQKHLRGERTDSAHTSGRKRRNFGVLRSPRRSSRTCRPRNSA
eukprot:4004228-Prymnesium_polylepis.1